MILEFNQSKFLTLFSNINDLYVKGKISDEYLSEKFNIVCQMFGNKNNSVIPYDVDKNIKSVCEYLKISNDNLISTNQTLQNQDILYQI